MHWLAISRYIRFGGYNIINSLPFNSYERKFIRKIREDGLIEIVLPWTDKGYGIVVKTTGRTIKETEMIGKIIMEEYGGI